MELFLANIPPKGQPFPEIRGPSVKDKVCIVGAGPAGIHMAIELKNKNYTNVQIFEKSNRVGGKSYDITIDGFYRPMGTVFLQTDYFEDVVAFANRYKAGDLHTLDPSGVSKKLKIHGASKGI